MDKNPWKKVLIIAGVVLALVLIVVFSVKGCSTKTATTTPPPSKSAGTQSGKDMASSVAQTPSESSQSTTPKIELSLPGLESRVDTLTLAVMASTNTATATNPAEKMLAITQEAAGERETPEERYQRFLKYLREHSNR